MRRLAAAASVLTALLSASAFAVPAQAAPAEHVPSFTHGMVHAPRGGVIRSGPSTTYAVQGRLRHNQIVPLLCETYGQDVRGHRLWYKLNDRPEMWASSTLIARVDQDPIWCSYHGTAAYPLHHHAKKHSTKKQHLKKQHQSVEQQTLLPQNPQFPQFPQTAQTAQTAQSIENPQLRRQELQRLQQELQREHNENRPQTLAGYPAQIGGNR